MVKNVSVLGSTGSIGTQSLEVARDLGVGVAALAARENTELLKQQILEFTPRIAAVFDEEKGERLRRELKGTKTVILTGIEGMIAAATAEEADTAILSIVGNAGILPAFKAIEAGKNLALANKETLVSAGELIINAARKNGISIYPIDSEHSAIFQCMEGNRGNPVKRILLTASGGPFRGRTRESLKNVTAEEALCHPTWSMGRKITIDSATMMNKGLEVIEAKWLFGVPTDRIEILVHPQSIVHSAVEFMDNAVLAQLGMPDMRIPIAYALTYPERPANDFKRLDFSVINNLTFEKPDMETFTALKLAYRAAETGGTMPAVMNGANEAAVERFLKGEAGFLDIPEIIEKTMNAYTVKYGYTLEDVLDADAWARGYAGSLIEVRSFD